jgi:hypothetical protein
MITHTRARRQSIVLHNTHTHTHTLHTPPDIGPYNWRRVLVIYAIQSIFVPCLHYQPLSMHSHSSLYTHSLHLMLLVPVFVLLLMLLVVPSRIVHDWNYMKCYNWTEIVSKAVVNVLISAYAFG